MKTALASLLVITPIFGQEIPKFQLDPTRLRAALNKPRPVQMRTAALAPPPYTCAIRLCEIDPPAPDAAITRIEPDPTRRFSSGIVQLPAPACPKR